MLDISPTFLASFDKVLCHFCSLSFPFVEIDIGTYKDCNTRILTHPILLNVNAFHNHTKRHPINLDFDEVLVLDEVLNINDSDP